METKICTLCKQEKAIECFAHKRNSYQARCKDCFNLYTRAHYQKNKDSYKEKAIIHNSKYRLRNLQYIVDFFKLHPCIDCGETDPIVLEFDHQRDKLYCVSEMHTHSFDSLKKEIAKCEVRCRNCHKRKTAKDYDYYKGIIF
jgi:5-methylcytosine-specific restriction endonuclease McrA